MPLILCSDMESIMESIVETEAEHEAECEKSAEGEARSPAEEAPAQLLVSSVAECILQTAQAAELEARATTGDSRVRALTERLSHRKVG